MYIYIYIYLSLSLSLYIYIYIYIYEASSAAAAAMVPRDRRRARSARGGRPEEGKSLIISKFLIKENYVFKGKSLLSRRASFQAVGQPSGRQTWPRPDQTRPDQENRPDKTDWSGLVWSGWPNGRAGLAGQPGASRNRAPPAGKRVGRTALT